jgi:hypothetical protein
MTAETKHNVLIIAIWVGVIGGGLYWLNQRNKKAAAAAPPASPATAKV